MIYSLPKNISVNDGNFPISSEIINVKKNWQYRDILYGVVLIEPKILDLGNLASERVDIIQVWNISGEDLVLNNITSSNSSGLFLEGKTSGFIVNGETLNYNLTSTVNGPSNIDATFTYNFDKTEFNSSFSVLGTRIPIFDYELEWSSGQNVYYKHNTNILESFNGEESRFGLTENPRRTLEYYYKILSSNRRNFENLIYNAQNSIFQVPLFLQPGYILQDALVGDNVIYIDVENTDIQEGFSVYIGDFYNNQVAKIETYNEITGQAILENNLSSDVFIDQKVFLLASCRMTSSLNMESKTRDFTETLIRFDIEDNTINNIINKDDELEEYDGLKVIYQKPSIDVTINRIYNRKVDVVDNSFGVRSYFNQDSTPEIIMNHRFDVVGKDNIKNVIAFFDNAKGRLNEFLITSGMSDIIVVSDIQASETTIEVEDNNQSEFNNNVQKNKIRIETENDVFYKTILNTESENGILKLFLDSNFGKDIIKEDIINIQYLSNARLNNDEIQIKYITSDFVNISVDCKIFRNPS